MIEHLGTKYTIKPLTITDIMALYQSIADSVKGKEMQEAVPIVITALLSTATGVSQAETRGWSMGLQLKVLDAVLVASEIDVQTLTSLTSIANKGR